ncbi:MAG: MaoC/PaaZ C-terminal domain-containing protein [Pseudomonadales bacterium]
MDERRGRAFYFEDYCIGQHHRSIAYTVGKQEIIDFAKQWDPQPFHIDEELANKSIFGGLTCCSAHIFSIFCAISQQWESGALQQPLASLGFDQLRMLKPVYAGDTLINIATVEEARRSNSNPAAGIVRSQCQMYNQKEEEVFHLQASFMMRCRNVFPHNNAEEKSK